MPYIPPHLRPGYVPKAVTVTVVRRGVHFPTNALNATNATVNYVVPTVVHNPTRKNAARSILRRTVRVSPNKEAIVVPTNNIMKLPPKYRDMLLASGVKPTKTRKSKKSKKSRRTRKTHRGRTVRKH